MYPIAITPPQHHDDLGRSALPNAPVVPDTARRRPLRTTRAAVAHGLHAAARLVEPAPSHRRSFHAGPGLRA